MEHTATYSPEDNKLRLYPAFRLSTDEYNRMKAAGFKWAPRQELFVAPMWTPNREDLLIEMCGEIGDEDTSLVDRAEERAERFEGYSENRTQDAERAHAAVDAICEHIPLGQPILIGHHSERHARKDAEKIQNGMRKAVKMWETAKYWEQRAAGALHHAKYKELPAVRHRRIKGLEADARKQTKLIKESQDALAAWQMCAAEQDAEKQRKIALLLAGGGCSFRMAKKAEDRQDWSYQCSAYDALTNNSPTLYAPRTFEEVLQTALSPRVYPASIARHQRWLDHYNNRIAYERAMLAESGGIVADQKKPEKGGAIRCWVRRGTWVEVIKVNKVSVSVRDNWGNGGADFPRTIKLDDITEILSKAEFEAMKTGGQVAETPAARAEGWQERAHAEAVAAQALKPVDETRTKIDALRESLKAGVQVVSAPQLFPTPPELAARMADEADLQPGSDVLEPSAGTGNICKAITDAEPTAKVFAVEINHSLCERLSQTINTPEDAAEGISRNVLQGDFLYLSRTVISESSTV